MVDSVGPSVGGGGPSSDLGIGSIGSSGLSAFGLGGPNPGGGVGSGGGFSGTLDGLGLTPIGSSGLDAFGINGPNLGAGRVIGPGAGTPDPFRFEPPPPPNYASLGLDPMIALQPGRIGMSLDQLQFEDNMARRCHGNPY